MRKSKRLRYLLISLVIGLGVYGIGSIGYKYLNQVARQKIMSAPIAPLTVEEKVEDFEYLYETIVENYPFLEVNKRLTGLDWASQKEVYLERIKRTSTDEEFNNALAEILSDLHNGHTKMMDKTNIKSLRNTYYRSKKQGSWQAINFDMLNHPLVLKRYRMADILPIIKNTSNKNTTQASISNASIKNIIKDKIAYIHIPQMIQPWEMSGDQEIIDPYLQEIKDYQALIIDIRGNGGGNSSYWSHYLVPSIIAQPYSAETYNFWKDGELINAFIKARYHSKMFINKVSKLDTTQLPMLPPEIHESFTYYSKGTITTNPSETSIGFKGNIYLLVDSGVYSSSEALAMFAKESGFATLIGEKTGGDGIGTDPLLAMLPNSGYVFKFSKDMGTTGDGTCNEEHKTVPHYEIKSPERTDFSNDACIQKVLALEGQ